MPVITNTFKIQVEQGIAKMKKRGSYVNKILTLLSHGKASKEIAGEIFLSYRTVENIISRLCTIFRCANRTELVATALRLKIIE